MSSPRWHWSPYSGIPYLLQSVTHNIPTHALQTRCLHFPQWPAARPLRCRRSSCLRTIFENPIGSWNLPETKHVGLPKLIMTFFHFHPHPYTHLEVSLKYLFVPVYYQVLGILINLVTLSNPVRGLVRLFAWYIELLSIEFLNAKHAERKNYDVKWRHSVANMTSSIHL